MVDVNDIDKSINELRRKRDKLGLACTMRDPIVPAATQMINEMLGTNTQLTDRSAPQDQQSDTGLELSDRPS